MRFIIVAVIALGAAAVGCSTIDPAPKLKAATSAIDAAKSLGADSFPASKELLDKAQGYLTSAQALIGKGSKEEAIRQLGLAQAAADDAKVTAQEASARAKIPPLDQKIAELKAKLGK